MADYTYAYNGPEEGVAKAVLKAAPLSTKTSIEMSKHLKGRTTTAAKALLERVIKQEEALPFTRFTNGLGHKKNMGSGRYPEKAAKAFLKLISSAEANANHAGMSNELKIIHLLAQEASRPYHYGRLRRRQVKATHVEIVVQETETKKRPAAKKKAAAQPTPAKKQEQPVTEKKPGATTPAATKTAPAQEAPAKQPEQQPTAPPQEAAPKKQPTTTPSPAQPKENAQP